MFLKELKEMNEKYTYAQQTIDKLQRKQGKNITAHFFNPYRLLISARFATFST